MNCLKTFLCKEFFVIIWAAMVHRQLSLVFCRETKIFCFFPEVPVTKVRVSAPAPYKNPTSETHNQQGIIQSDISFGGVKVRERKFSLKFFFLKKKTGSWMSAPSLRLLRSYF